MPIGAQIAALGLGDVVGRYADADLVQQRRLSVEIRLGLYEQPIAPHILEPLLAAWQAQRVESGAPSAVRSSALIEDREGANFAGQFESFLGIDERGRIPHRRARLLGGAVDHQRAPLHGEP